MLHQGVQIDLVLTAEMPEIKHQQLSFNSNYSRACTAERVLQDWSLGRFYFIATTQPFAACKLASKLFWFLTLKLPIRLMKFDQVQEVVCLRGKFLFSFKNTINYKE